MTDKETKDTSLIANGFISTLNETLDELNIKRNALAVEAKVRPLTINEIASGKAKQITFVTLKKILDALNQIAKDKGINKTYTIEDVVKYGQEDSK
ncbi:helix-turn-helix domain-containing protein [Bacillus sp. JJ1532]|uniref:helix-turn-helix domain-containing protein n=1 Tax=Bacillus sp. JJ1532 TaxID=3122958 RepID=UPI002FFE5202